MDNKLKAGDFIREKKQEPLKCGSPASLKEEPEQEKTLADVIVEAYQNRLEREPETVKEEIEDYLEYLDPEDREQFLKEKLSESEGTK